MTDFLNKRPSGWRIGQTLFNFLEFLKTQKGFSSDATGEINPETGNLLYSNTRMADPFHIQDSEIEKLYQEFLEYCK